MLEEVTYFYIVNNLNKMFDGFFGFVLFRSSIENNNFSKIQHVQAQSKL